MASKTCVQCGASLEESANFCPSCGTRVASDSAPSGANPASAAGGTVQESAPTTNAPSADLQRNVAGLLCYILLFISGILFLLIEPYNKDKFVRFHAFQSIFFFIAWVVIGVLANVVGLIVTAILPGPLDFLSVIFQSLVTLGLLFLWIFLMYKAYSDEMYRLPVIGDFAAKQA
ncbi:MAG TPA: zinc-ribbon domain-containing protein [Acidobacteriota bacterium]|jgi:uncharacterized membrane protein